MTSSSSNSHSNSDPNSNSLSVPHIHDHHISNDISIPAVTDVPPSDKSDFNNFKLSQSQITSASGALAGFLAGIAVCPLDVAKTRFQAQGAYLRTLKHEKNLTQFDKFKYKGAFQSMRLIWKEEGIRGLYRGLVPITLGYFPTWMIYFTCYEKFKKFYSGFIPDENLSYFVSAISAGAISTTATNPIWVVKTRLMLQMDQGKTIYDRFKLPTSIAAKASATTASASATSTTTAKKQWYNGTIDAFIKMYKNEGFGVFYKGLLPSYFGLVHVAIQFPLYENFKKLFKIENYADQADESKTWGTFTKFILASSLSKMIASGITYPHELVRTRLQIFSTNSSFIQESQIRGLIRVITSIYGTEGLRGFYSGFVINLARTVPASAVTMVSFEYFKKYFQKFS